MEHLEHPEVIDELSDNFTNLFQQVFSIIREGSLSVDGRKQFGS
jgi:hypothetical protein